MQGKFIAAIMGLALLTPSISFAQGMPALLTPSTSDASAGSTSASAPSPSSPASVGETDADPVTTGTVIREEEEATKIQLPADLERTTFALSDQIQFEGDAAAAGKRPVEAQFSDPSVAGAEIREKIRVKGLMEYETDTDGKIKGTMNWYGVRNQENNEERDIGGTLESRFTTSDPEVPTGQTISAQGDVPAALAAARALLEEGGTVPEEKVESDSGGGSGSATGGSQYAASGGEASNSALEGFELPEAKEEEEEKVDDIGLTEAGCPIKISEDKTVAQVQSQSTKNGTPQGDCSPSGLNLPIQKSYAACEDIVDLDARSAWASFRRYYVDQGGTTQYVDDECVRDDDLEFEMYQDSSVCSFDLELAPEPGTAYNRGKWYYQNKNNNRVEVSGCERIEGETAEIQSTTDGCVPRHEFDEDQSYELVRKYYVWEDVQRIVSECIDSGNTFTHIHKTNVCSDLTPSQADLANFKEGDAALVAVAQERIAINLNGKETYITECQPIDNQSAELVKDTNGCDTTFFHYLSSGESYGSTKWKYQFAGKPEITLTSCIQDNDVKYDHQTRINGYEHHDTQLFSYPKTEIYIEAFGREEMVSGPQVREGAPQLDYVFQQNVLVATGEIFYEGDTSCEKFMRRNDVDRYLKGDLVSVYDDVKGEGEALSQGDGCDVVITWEEPTNDLWGVSLGYGSNQAMRTSNSRVGPSAKCGYSRAYRKNWYQAGSDGDTVCNSSYVEAANHCSWTFAVATRKVVREDSQIVGNPAQNTCQLVNSAPSVYTSTPERSCDSTARYRSPGYAAYPTMTNSAKSSCLGSWGWW
jgi:hypothetical protein